MPDIGKSLLFLIRRRLEIYAELGNLSLGTTGHSRTVNITSLEFLIALQKYEWR